MIDAIVSAYALGLVAHLLLNWMRSVQTEKARAWLARFYEPMLGKIRARIKPVRMGGSFWDIAPAVLLMALMVMKRLVLYFLPRGL